jgi:DNA-binding response OmpR family regulator
MTRKSNPRLGVVDGDSGFEIVLGRRLTAAGWERTMLSGSESVEELVSLKLNAILLDPSALGADPWMPLKAICGGLPGLAVLVFSAESTVEQRVRGLRLGVDDWISRPCHPEEVLARVEAVLRRKQPSPGRLAPRSVLAGELEIRADLFQALVDGQSVGLTRREFEVLQVLAQAQGQVIERDEIYHRVWGYAMAHGDRSVDVFVRKLRQKLEGHSDSTYIHTHHGVGYRFEPDPGNDSDVPADDPSANRGSQTFHNTATAA